MMSTFLMIKATLNSRLWCNRVIGYIKFIHAKSQHLTEEENLIIQNKVLRGQCIEGTTQII